MLNVMLSESCIFIYIYIRIIQQNSCVIIYQVTSQLSHVYDFCMFCHETNNQHFHVSSDISRLIMVLWLNNGNWRRLFTVHIFQPLMHVYSLVNNKLLVKAD